MNLKHRKISPYGYAIYVLAALALAGIVFFYEIHLNNEPLITVVPNPPFIANTSVSLSRNQNIQPLSLLYATTLAQQELGLGQRTSLPSDEGMLFVFQTPSNYGFWMKDMHFSIDMIWMDNNFVITHIASNVSPDTYPQSFYPGVNSSYVLETNAGYSQKNNLSVGETLDFVKNSLQNNQ